MVKNNKRLLYWIQVFVWLGFIFVLSSVPAASLPAMPSDLWLFWAHRTAHFGEYSILGVLVLRAYAYNKARIGVITILFLSVFILLSGVFDEWHQSFIPGRHSQLIDVVFDTICGALGMVVYKILVNWRIRNMFQARTDRINICIISPGLPIPPSKGGAIETLVYETVKKYQHTYAQIYSQQAVPADNAKDNTERIEYIQFSQLPLLDRLEKFLNGYGRSGFFGLYDFFFIRKVLNGLKVVPDIFHVHNRFYYIPLIKDRYPDKQIILHMNNDFLFEYPELKDKYIQVLSKVDCVIGCSAFVSNSIQLNSGIPKEKVKVIHNGVSLQWFKKLPHNDPKMLEWRNKLGFKENEKVIVFIGRLLALKGPHILIKAFDKIAQGFPDARLLIVGSSWYAQEDQTEYIKELSSLSDPFKDKIKFSGYVSHDQLNYLYNLSVITVVPSIVNEAFGLVILESMAAGSAVIGSSVGGIPEIIKDKETGLLVRSDDVKALEEKIRFLLDHEDERRRLIENALEYVQGSDWSVVASKIESVYLDLKKNRIS